MYVVGLFGVLWEVVVIVVVLWVWCGVVVWVEGFVWVVESGVGFWLCWCRLWVL